MLTITIFGQITDITGSGTIVLDPVSDTDELLRGLIVKYPELEKSKFAIAVNKKIIKENTPLTADSTVALLPPFSGG